MPALSSDPDIALAARWASYYRERGWNPLPSRPDEKRPLVKFSPWWDEPAPSDLFDRFPTTNVQLMTGRRWGLLAIDLDGPAARDWFHGKGRVPPTWVTHSGGDGLHLWFTLPPGLGRPLPKAFLWKGDGKHNAVERIGDKSLLMAPPSIHPTTHQRYRFLDARHSPKRLPLPAPCPGWVLALPPIVPPKVVPPIAPCALRVPARPVATGRYRTADVLAAIHDKIGLCRQWGVRFTGTVRGEWHEAHAYDREDANPSAAVNAASGWYRDLGSGASMGLFDLATALGVYGDWSEAAADLAWRFNAREAS